MRYQALKRLITLFCLFLDRGWREWRIELGVELGIELGVGTRSELVNKAAS